MDKAKEVFRYFVIGTIFIVLIISLIVLKGSLTGYGIFDPAGLIERGENWNKINNSGNTESLHIYNSPINILNNSEFIEIDTFISNSSDPSYEFEVNGSVLYSVFFDEDPTTGQPVKYVKDSVEIAFRPMPLNYRNAISQLEQISNVLSVTGIPKDNFFTYPNVYGSGIDLKYTYLPTLLKKELVINSSTDLPLPGLSNHENITLEMNFNFNTNSPRLIVNGTDLLASNNEITTQERVEIQDSGGNILYIFPKPYARDSNGSRTEMTYIFKKQGPSLSVRITTPYDWLNATDRVYPVYIDPTIKISSGSGKDSHIKEDKPNDNFGLDSELWIKGVNSKRYSYLEFNISGIPNNQIIDNASLCLFLWDDKGSQTISAHHVYENLNETGITWNNQPCGTSFDNSTACNLTAESNLSNDGSQDDTWQCWDIKNMITQEYNNDTEKISIVLRTTDSGNTDKFYSKEHSNESLWPYLNVTYHISDSSPPNVTINTPLAQTYTETNITFNITAVDEFSVDTCLYSLNSGTTNYTMTNIGNEWNATNSSMSEGSHTTTYYCNDTNNKLNNTETITFSIDTKDPSINIILANNTGSNNINQDINFTLIESSPDSCWYSNDSYSINTSLPCTGPNTNITNITWTEGQHNITIYANDSLGRENSSSITFTVDTTNPSLNLTEPNGIKTSRTNIPIEFSANDTNIQTCLYNVYRGTTNEISNTTINCSNSSSFDVTIDADFILNFYINDSAGNTNNTNISFSVTTSSGGGSGGGGSSGSSGGGGILANGKLEVSKIGTIITNRGDSKILALNIKNIGGRFLNDCRLIVSGSISAWIQSDQFQGISPGENVDFVFKLNIPEDTPIKDYNGILDINCKENSNSQNITISILEGLASIEIIDIIKESSGLNISYIFDNRNLLGGNIEIDIWIIDEQGVEIKRIKDSFSVNRDSIIKRNILIELPRSSIGIHELYFALSSDIENYLKRSIILGESLTTGQAIFNVVKGKGLPYLIFLFIIGIGIFFIFRRYRKSARKNTGKKNLKKHNFKYGLFFLFL